MLLTAELLLLTAELLLLTAELLLLTAELLLLTAELLLLTAGLLLLTTAAVVGMQVLCVQPCTGYVQPGGSAVCKVTLSSHTSPSVYHLDLLCQVLNKLTYSTVFPDIQNIQSFVN